MMQDEAPSEKDWNALVLSVMVCHDEVTKIVWMFNKACRIGGNTHPKQTFYRFHDANLPPSTGNA